MSRTRYYILHRGVRKGPYSSDRLYKKIHDGELGTNTLCCQHKLLQQDPDAPWFPASKILGKFSPQQQPQQNQLHRIRRTKMVPTSEELPATANTGAVIVTLLGIGILVYFFYFFSPDAPAASGFTPDTSAVSHEVLIQKLTRIGGLITGTLVAVAGLLGAVAGPAREED